MLEINSEDSSENIGRVDPRKVDDFRKNLRIQKCSDNSVSADVFHEPKILYFDIETTDFSGGFGSMLMFAYCWHHQGGKDETKVVTLLDDPRWRTLEPEKCDFYLIQKLAELVNAADITVGHFSSKFDMPFLNTRLAIHDLFITNAKRKNIFDTCMVAKYHFKFWGSFCNNRLKSIAKAFGCDEQKDELPLTVWQRSKMVGYEPYFSEAVLQMAEYCKQDVRTLYDIAQKMWTSAKHLPSYQAITGVDKLCCPLAICGSEDIEEEGIDACKTSAFKQYRCKKCGNVFRARNDLRKFKSGVLY